MMQLQTLMTNTGHYLWGKSDTELDAEKASGGIQGRRFKELARGATLLSGVVGSAFLGLSLLGKRDQETVVSGGAIGRRAGAAPVVKKGVPTQSVIPGTPFLLQLRPSDYFSDSDSGGFTLQAVRKGQQSLPSWMNSLKQGLYYTTQYSVASCIDIYVVDNLAYFAGDSYGLQIIDVSNLFFDESNPTNPTLKGSYDTPGTAQAVYVVGNLAYVADYDFGLQIIDVSNPSSPTLKGTYNTPGNAEGVKVVGNLAYVADGSSGLQIIDVSNPSSPTLKGTYNTPGNAYAVHIVNNLAYVADYDFGLQIINVSNPSSPTFKSSYNTPGNAEGVKVVGNLAYVADGDFGLQIIDVSNTSAPTLKGSYATGYAQDLDVVGNLAYVTLGFPFFAGGLQIIDVSNPYNLTLKGSLNGGSLSTVEVVGDFVYSGSWNAGAGLVIHETGFKLSGVAAQTDVGNYELELIAVDPNQNRASTPVIVRVESPPLSAGSIPTLLANVDAPFSYFIDQSVFPDPNGDVVFYAAKKTDQSPLPSWLSFSPIGIFSGTPRSSDTGTIGVQLFAYDGIVLDRANTTFSLIVEHFPELSVPIPNQAAQVNRPYSFTVSSQTFADRDVGDTLTYSARQSNGDPLPSWLSFNPATRQFTGTPTSSDAGSISIRVSVADTPGAAASTTFTLGVGEFPSLQNPIPDQLAAVGVSYVYSVPVNTFTTPAGELLSYRATKADGSLLPAWLGFLGARLEFQGTPRSFDKGQVSLKVMAQDTKGGTAESAFDLNVVDALSQEIGRVGGSFIYTIPSDMIKTPLGPVTYTVTLGDGSSLPSWLVYNPATHVISGVPPTGSEGLYTILVSANDGIQAPVLGSVTLNVGPNAAPKVANPLSNQVAQVGQAYRFVVPDNTFVDPNGDFLSLSAKKADGRPLPAWLSFNDRTLEGTPGSSDTGAFTDKTTSLGICASDGDLEACTLFDLSVQGISKEERMVSILGPLGTAIGLGAAWYKKRGLLLNPWNRKNYDKGTRTLSVGESFTYKLQASPEEIKLVKAYKGQRMYADLPAPKSLDERGCLEWLKHDKSMAGGSLLPRWLEYDQGKNQLLTKEGPQSEDVGIYTIRVFGHGEVILEEVKFDVGGQGGKGTEMHSF